MDNIRINVNLLSISPCEIKLNLMKIQTIVFKKMRVKWRPIRTDLNEL